MAVGIRRTDLATHLYPQKLTLTSPTRGGRSVGIVRSRTKATELVKLNHDFTECVCAYHQCTSRYVLPKVRD
jgi:hypothetical protein